MMLNMVEPGRDRSAAHPAPPPAARPLVERPATGRHVRQGASVRGWAVTLALEGAGPYRLVGEDTIDAALATAARAIAETGEPVGLLVWRGRHAWVMSRLRRDRRPARPDPTARVTAATIYDPLYPYGSKAWGRSPAPGDVTRPRAQVGRQFVPRRMSAWLNGVGGEPPSDARSASTCSCCRTTPTSRSRRSPALTRADSGRPRRRTRRTVSSVVGSSAAMTCPAPSRRRAPPARPRSRRASRSAPVTRRRRSPRRAASPDRGSGYRTVRPTVISSVAGSRPRRGARRVEVGAHAWRAARPGSPNQARFQASA